MRLTLNVLRCPDAAVPESRTSGGDDIAIGRGLECDWVLQDPDRVLSKRHCVLEFRGGYWQVRDTSTNGTFLNGAAEPVGREMVAPVSDGDRLRFGNYEIELRIAADSNAGWGAAPGAAPAAPAAWGDAAIGSSSGPGRPATDPFADPLSAPVPGFGGGALPGGPGGLPADWDPLADLAPMPDHSPAASDAFVPPKPIALPHASAIPPDWDPFGDSPPGGAPRATTPPAPAGAGSQEGLPSDWDPLADLAAPTPPAPPAARQAPPPSPAVPTVAPRNADTAAGDMLRPSETVPDRAVAPAAAPTQAPFPPAVEPIQAPFPPAAEPMQPRVAPPAGPVPAAVPPAALALSEAVSEEDPFAEEGVPSRSIPHPDDIAAAVPVAVPPARPAAAGPAAMQHPVVPPSSAGAAAMPATTGDLAAAMAALLRGAGVAPGALHGAAADNPLAVFEQTGAALRAAVAGIRALLIARADVKREFRIEQTMLRAAGNNPLKFAATDDMAIAALMAGQSTRAVAETVNDLTAHEVATLAATQAAARALLGRLAPEVVEENDAGGGGLFGSKEKRLWEAYRKLHTKVTDQFEDDFDSAFGKEFARAYEQAVASREG